MPKSAPTSTLRTLKTGSCASLSGKSTLTFVLCANEAGDLHVRLTGNSSSGNFSSEPVAFKDILEALRKEQEGFSALALRPLYTKQSANNRGFLMAALRSLGVVEVLPDKQKLYRLGEDAESRVQDFIGGASKASGSGKRKRAPRKKAAASSA